MLDNIKCKKKGGLRRSMTQKNKEFAPANLYTDEELKKAAYGECGKSRKESPELEDIITEVIEFCNANGGRGHETGTWDYKGMRAQVQRIINKVREEI
jgi:hypothetical protein